MNGKRIIGLCLLTSLNLHCMLTVKPVRRENGGKIPRFIKTDSATSSVKKYIEEIKENEKCIASENYEHNKHNFFVVNGDIPTQIVTHLDHLSNIQLIRSSKHLYEKHRKQAPDGTIIYSNCLFTKLPFSFESHTRAMFHYAAFNKKQAEMLLEIEDTDGSRLAMLRKFSIDASDHNAVINFYQQNFSSDHIHYLLRDPMFLQIMLKRGVSPNATDEKGITLLMYSIFKDNALDLLNILLKDPRIDINAKNKLGNTVLMSTLVIENAAILNALLKHPNLDINAKDNDGNTVLLWALTIKNAVELLNILLKHPCIDINAKNKYGLTACMYAISRNTATEILHILLKHPNLDINAKDENGFTALMYAITRNNTTELLDILLKHPNLDINAKNNDGDTVLMWALTRKNAVELLNILLKHPHVDINAKDNDGFIADYAIVRNNPDILTALLNNAPTEIAVSSFAYWYNIVNMYRQNPEVTRLLSERTSFSTKVKLPAIFCMLMAGCMLYHKK